MNNNFKKNGMSRELNLKIRLLIFSFILIFPGTSFPQKFTIPVLPDTQCEINYNPDMFNCQLKWIADKRDSLNVPIVLHVGDLVDFDNIEHFKRASDGFNILDRARIPYALCLGNHDTGAVGINTGSAAPGNTNLNLRVTKKFNSYFPVRRFSKQKGRFEKKKSDNTYYVFEAGGLKWLVISLEFCTRQKPLEWAGEIISKFPKYNVIILTHYYLTSRGEIAQNNAGYGDLEPKSIFDQLITQHPNIILVLSGHVGTSASRIDQGKAGNNIYEILQDYQNVDNGGGYIRLLEIDPERKTISGKMYSPYYNRTLADLSFFLFSNVDFIKKK